MCGMDSEVTVLDTGGWSRRVTSADDALMMMMMMVVVVVFQGVCLRLTL